jgi:hypothetical protein
LASLDTDNAYPINKQLLARAFEGYNPSEYKGPNISSSKYNIEIPEYKVNFEDILTPEGKKLIEDTRTLQEKMLSRPLNSATSGENPGVKVTKSLRKADSDIDKMNTYHDANVEEYNQATDSNITSVPFRTDRSNRQIKMLPKSDFIELAKTLKTNSPSSDVANIGGVYSRKLDTVHLKSDGTPSNAYHEFLHSNHYGETNPEVTEWRINQLIDPEKVANLSDAGKKYYLSSSEFPVHLRQFGENKGIEVGQPYPGDYAFDSLMFGQNGGFSGASTYAKGTRIDSPSEDKQLLWRALNGTLFGTIPAAVLGTLYETSQNGNAHAYGGPLNTYKSWNDLSIKEKSEMMKVAIRNGITNLADIKAKYNEFAEGGYMASEEDNDVNMYGNGSQMNRDSWRNQHQGRWFSFLKRKGLNNSDALRLSGFFTAQDGLESAGGTSSAARQKNNFGGMQRNGKNISYPSAEAYMEDKWNMMNSKFKSALGARTIDEYATILGNPDTAGKGYLYYVTDQAKYDPKSPVWRAAQTKHMHNYINGMRSWAGQGTVKFNDGNYSYNQGNWPQGYVYDVLPQLFAMDGVPITVSSGYRPGAVVKGTNRASRHGMHQAADIVGDFAKIQQVLDNPYSNVSRWMLANGYGYLNETSGPGGTTKHWKDHNRDHSHYHIGMDSSLAQQYASRFKGMNLQPQMAYNPFDGWQFQNESILNGSYNPERDSIIVNQAQQLAQLQAAYDKQEKESLLAAQQQALAQEREAQRNRTNLALQMVGMMGGDDSDNSYYDMWKPLINMGAYGGHLYDGWTEPAGLMNRKRLDDIQNLNNDILDFEKNASSNNEFSTITDAETGEVGQIMGITPDGTYRTVYPSGTYNMTLDLPNTDVLGSKAHMKAARGLEAPLLGGELKDNQYRTMPTNSEANAFADAWTEQTAPTVGHLISAGLKPLDLITPSRYVGLLDSDNKNGFLHLFDEDNRGLFINDNPNGMFSKRYAEEHPYWAMAGNMAFDIPSSIAVGWAIGKGYNAASNAYNAGKASFDEWNKARQLSRAINKEVDGIRLATKEPVVENISLLSNNTSSPSLLQIENLNNNGVMYSRDPVSYNAPYANLVTTQAAANKGRQDLISDIVSDWRRERMRNAGISEENIDRIVKSQRDKVEAVPFDFSKTRKDLDAMGITAPRPAKTYTLSDGTRVIDYNTGLDISIANDLGNDARSTAFHEAGHYALNNANGLTSGAQPTNFADPFFSPVKYDFSTTRTSIIPRGDAWQHQLIDYNQQLLPPESPYYKSIMDKRYDVRKDAIGVRDQLVRDGLSEEEANKTVLDIVKADYMWNAQEQDRHLKEFFHYKVKPLLKNPNDEAEIEKVLTEHPELVKNNAFIKQLMDELRPGTIKDYARVLAGMLSTLPIVNSITTNN